MHRVCSYSHCISWIRSQQTATCSYHRTIDFNDLESPANVLFPVQHVSIQTGPIDERLPSRIPLSFFQPSLEHGARNLTIGNDLHVLAMKDKVGDDDHPSRIKSTECFLVDTCIIDISLSNFLLSESANDYAYEIAACVCSGMSSLQHPRKSACLLSFVPVGFQVLHYCTYRHRMLCNLYVSEALWRAWHESVP